MRGGFLKPFVVVPVLEGKPKAVLLILIALFLYLHKNQQYAGKERSICEERPKSVAVSSANATRVCLYWAIECGEIVADQLSYSPEGVGKGVGDSRQDKAYQLFLGK